MLFIYASKKVQGFSIQSVMILIHGLRHNWVCTFEQEKTRPAEAILKSFNCINLEPYITYI